MKASNDPPLALTFDDILLQPAMSEVLPSEVNLGVTLRKRDEFNLNVPILSAAMDRVTEAAMAIELAQVGGLGVIHRNMPDKKQAAEVEQVKRHESGVVENPMHVKPQMSVADAMQIKQATGYSGLPVVDEDGRVVGIVTNRDLRFERKLSRKIEEVMTRRDRLVTVQPGCTIARARKLMHEHRIERVIVEDRNQRLKGLMTVKDIILSEKYPNACRDDSGSLRIAAAVGIGDYDRIDKLIDAGADAIVVDSAHGHSKAVVDTVANLRQRHQKVLLIAGNVAVADSAKALAVAGADVIKVGVGPGSICTTRVVTGVGMPQFTAVQEAVRGLGKRAGKVSVIADGGIRFSGDIVKALVAGAQAVMLGSLLAGTTEAPGEIELSQGRTYKSYRGMGSLGAMRKGSADRYFQQVNTQSGKLVPEGVEGRVPYKGSVHDVVTQLIGGLRSAMGYLGAKHITQLSKAKYVRITAAGMQESHVHSVQITNEAPNYQIDVD